MSAFAYREGALHAEQVRLSTIAEQFGTPCFVYSRAALEQAYAEFHQALAGRDALICYAVKANSNIAVLDLFARLGAGFDIVSGGELARVLAAGGAPDKIIFSGVGKSEAELQRALAARICCFNVESTSELERLNRIAVSLRRRAPIALRVNPDVDPKTHPYISTGLRSDKFGVAFDAAMPLYRLAQTMPGIEGIGIACHIGSQLLDPAPVLEAAQRVLALADQLALQGVALRHIDLGGGLGIRYQDEQPPAVADYLRPLLDLFRTRRERLLFEPGRRLVGNAGVLVTRIEHLKQGPEKSFAIVNAAMNDLLRPALYDAWHDIVALAPRAAPPQRYDVVGPVCESSDFLGRSRALSVAEGDLLAILSTGAYAMSMSSNYNTRARAAEVMVDGDRAYLVRRRETVEQLFALESRLPAPD